MTRDKAITRAIRATFLLVAMISFVIPLLGYLGGGWDLGRTARLSAPMVWSLFAKDKRCSCTRETFKVLLVGSPVEDLSSRRSCFPCFLELSRFWLLSTCVSHLPLPLPSWV